MRIRKRQVPFPLPSLSFFPLSDPRLCGPSLVQLHPTSDSLLPQPSHLRDRPNQPLSPIGAAAGPADCFPSTDESPNLPQVVEKDEREELEEEKEGSNHTSKGSLFCAQVVVGIQQQSGAAQGAISRWCEGEKAFPLKKRKGNFQREANEDATPNEEKKMKSKMKTKMNKKCLQKNDHNQDDNGEAKESCADVGGAKKRGRGGALLEGSRCSRVNGRGWRCCQPTLVGYSLCEHHLGKGRLRSMTSVRSRSSAAAATKSSNESHPISLPPKHPKHESLGGDGRHDVAEAKPLWIAKKKTKLGTVKARSISSLLGQTANCPTVVPAQNNN